MALFVLFILGSSLGWFSSILVRTENARAILSQMALGVVAALVAGLISNGGNILGGLTLFGLGAGAVAAMAALVLYHAIVTRAQAAEG
ncbi:MAG: hypothetical protein AAF291_06285 [Pseudomonadota bacterium]